MIYITNSKGDGSPCERVYEGKVMKWYYCGSERELFDSLLNLLRGDRGFVILNVYGKPIPIPDDPEDFVVRERVREFKGVAYNVKRLDELIRRSSKFELKGRRLVSAKLYEVVSAEEILRLGIRILEPFELPLV
jgi:hypothetical protein